MVSCINFPSYFMAKFLNNILKSVPKPFSNIKNSFEFINKIKNFKIPNNYTMTGNNQEKFKRLSSMFRSIVREQFKKES